MNQYIKASVNRFLGWKLPADFAPDCGITFKPIDHPLCWPVGTNLLNDPQATAMLTHVAKPLIDRIDELEAQLAAAKKDAAWIPVSERLPVLKNNSSKEFLITCKRKHDGKSYVFTAQYLESLVLQSTDSDADEPEDGLPYTGWKQLEQVSSSEFDEAWFDVEKDGDLVTHWREKPLPPINKAIAGEAT